MIPAGAQWPVAVVFDCDGLLLDTTEAWRAAYALALGADRRSLDEQMLATLNGASVGGAARLLEVDSGQLREYLEQALTEEPSPMPGAPELIEALGPRVRLAVATNGPAGVVERALGAARLLDHFDAVVSAEDLPREKPAPDVYLAACEAIGVDPSDAIALEDSLVGVEAARRAGLIVVYVPSDTSQGADADLRVPRLDDPALLSLLGLDHRAPAHPDARIRSRQQLERICSGILSDDAVLSADPSEVHELVGHLHRNLIFWRRAQHRSADRTADPLQRLA